MAGSEAMLKDFDQLNIPELLELQRRIPARIEQLKRESLKNVRGEVEKIAAQHGLALDELISVLNSKGNKLKGQRVEAKYANPANPSQTWSGRGRKPQWVQELLDQGRALEELAK